MNPFKIFFFRWGDRGLEQVIYFHTASKSKKKFFFCGGGGGGGREGTRGGCGRGFMDAQTDKPQTNLPFNLFEVGGITIHKCTSYGPHKLNL